MHLLGAWLQYKDLCWTNICASQLSSNFYFNQFKHFITDWNEIRWTPARMNNVKLLLVSSVQGVGEAWSGAVFPLWEPCAKIRTWENHWEHCAVSGRCRLLHGRRASGKSGYNDTIDHSSCLYSHWGCTSCHFWWDDHDELSLHH